MTRLHKRLATKGIHWILGSTSELLVWLMRGALRDRANILLNSGFIVVDILTRRTSRPDWK